jgi:uncharacterized integral membrane protein
VRGILVVVVIVAIALVCFGIVNHDLSVNLDYFFGTWSGVSLQWLAAIAAALVIAVGLLAGGSAAVHAAGDRHKLERELEATYTRLRAAEARLGVAAAEDAAPVNADAIADAAAAPTDDAAAAGDDAATPGDEAATPADEAATPEPDGGAIA